ncbi:MAG TPA: 3-methyl-2-oxobutanoate hydroxymethyltransferase [Thiolapillus brandeum]|uniref:3-methyl-2-oxobutanoate hydroxymethyltransferase n=1 Tax=Thiolapillus brandeum TaxID=1076588 RepID=A0A831KCU7_9GAMM|nr:3-methyl-2-oxobutanoate hydroxymethyltransferase [Thiolapillus brandeum]
MNNKITLSTLQRMKAANEKIAVLTAYDAGFARLAEAAGVEVILVGDSLGMVVQGHDSTLPVTVDEMVYHTAMVNRGCGASLLIADMPFMSHGTPRQALDNAGRLMKEGGAHMVKLEGGHAQVETVRHLTHRAVPVCAHLGLLPQSIHQLGGYKVQGRDNHSAETILNDAHELQQAGAQMLVLECVPEILAREITLALDIPVIGIGAGRGCDGQVLVLHDMLGMTPGKAPSFSKNFMEEAGSIEAAMRAYVEAVHNGNFPAEEHCFQ